MKVQNLNEDHFQLLKDLDNIEARAEKSLEPRGGVESCNTVFNILEFPAARITSATPVVVNITAGSSRSCTCLRTCTQLAPGVGNENGPINTSTIPGIYKVV